MSDWLTQTPNALYEHDCFATQTLFNAYLPVVVMDTVDLEWAWDYVGHTVETETTHDTTKATGMVALTTCS